MVEKTKFPDHLQPRVEGSAPQSEARLNGKPVRDFTDEELAKALTDMRQKLDVQMQLTLGALAKLIENHASFIAMINILDFELQRRQAMKGKQ